MCGNLWHQVITNLISCKWIYGFYRAGAKGHLILCHPYDMSGIHFVSIYLANLLMYLLLQNMTPTKRSALRVSEGETTPSNSFKRRRQSLMDDYVGSVS